MYYMVIVIFYIKIKTVIKKILSLHITSIVFIINNIKMINLSIKLKKNFSFGKPQKDEKNLENKEIFLESQEKTKKINLKKNE